EARREAGDGSGRLGRYRRGPGRAPRNAWRTLVHQPLQRERGEADHDQRTPAEVVAAEAIEHHAANPGAEERADLVAEEHHPVERVEVGEAEHAADDPGDERRDAEPEEAHRGSEYQ